MKEIRAQTSVVEKDMVERISERTGISKIKVHRCMSVFRLAFKRYIKSKFDIPIRIKSVFTVYRGKSSAKKKDTIKLDDTHIPFR